MPNLRSQYLELQQRLISNLPDDAIVELAAIDTLADKPIYASLTKHRVPCLIVVTWRWHDGDIVRSYILPNQPGSVKVLGTDKLSIYDSAHWCAYGTFVSGVRHQHEERERARAAEDARLYLKKTYDDLKAAHD